jgi:hypothetical protein
MTAERGYVMLFHDRSDAGRLLAVQSRRFPTVRRDFTHFRGLSDQWGGQVNIGYPAEQAA